MLDIGTLVGYLTIDDSQANETFKKFPDKIRGMGTAGLAAAGIVAVAIGAALSKGLTETIDVEAANDKLVAQLGLTGPQSEEDTLNHEVQSMLTVPTPQEVWRAGSSATHNRYGGVDSFNYYDYSGAGMGSVERLYAALGSPRAAGF